MNENRELYSAQVAAARKEGLSVALGSTNACKTDRLALVMHRFATIGALDIPGMPSATPIENRRLQCKMRLRLAVCTCQYTSSHHEIEAGETSSALQKRQTVERLATDDRKGESQTPFRQNGHRPNKAYPSRTRAVIRRIHSRPTGIGFPGTPAGVWLEVRRVSLVNFPERTDDRDAR